MCRHYETDWNSLSLSLELFGFGRNALYDATSINPKYSGAILNFAPLWQLENTLPIQNNLKEKVMN